jgi:hypothetical protein
LNFPLAVAAALAGVAGELFALVPVLGEDVPDAP